VKECNGGRPTKTNYTLPGKSAAYSRIYRARKPDGEWLLALYGYNTFVDCVIAKLKLESERDIEMALFKKKRLQAQAAHIEGVANLFIRGTNINFPGCKFVFGVTTEKRRSIINLRITVKSDLINPPTSFYIYVFGVPRNVVWHAGESELYLTFELPPEVLKEYDSPGSWPRLLTKLLRFVFAAVVTPASGVLSWEVGDFVVHYTASRMRV